MRKFGYCIEHMFSALDTALKELSEVDLASLTDEELDDAVVDVLRRRQQLEAFEVELIGAWERRKSWRQDGSRCASTWLSKRTRSPKAECGSSLRLARVLLDMDLVAAAFCAGDINKAHVRRIAGVRNDRTEVAFVRDEALFVRWAMDLSFFEFCAELEMWLLDEDPDGSSQRDQDRRDRRDVWLAKSFGGMHLGKMTLDPVSGVIVGGELNRLEEQLFQADWNEARDRLGRTPLATELARTPAQRRADALVLMAERSARPNAGSAPRPSFTVVLGAPRLERMCRLSSGDTISPDALLPYIERAKLEAILFNDAEVAIRASRRRYFTGILRRIIEVRDGACSCGCGTPAEDCQMDHKVPHADGGMTCQCNGHPMCRPSNRHKGRRPWPLP